eukprot:4104630-Amphidinium_carterae.1
MTVARPCPHCDSSRCFSRKARTHGLFQGDTSSCSRHLLNIIAIPLVTDCIGVPQQSFYKLLSLVFGVLGCKSQRAGQTSDPIVTSTSLVIFCLESKQ